MTTGLLEIDQDELRLLDRMGNDGGWVLSVFLRLDLPEVPTRRVRGVELESRLTEAEQQLRGEAGEDVPESVLQSCLERVCAHLDEAVVDDDGVHGVGFYCGERGDLRAYALRRAPDFDVAAAFRRGPALEPLIEAMPGPLWGVALVSREHGRVFRGSEFGLAEVGAVDDEVHRRHSQGGWSQARYQRGVEKETADHVRRVCDLLFALHQRKAFDRILVLGAPEVWPVAEACLHPYLRRRLSGHIAVDVENATADEVLGRVRDLMAGERHDRERSVIERMEQELGRGGHAVAGPDEVAAAIADRRVETLLVDGGSRDERTEKAVEGAISQAAEVLVIEGDALEPHDHIAALLRY